MHYPLRPALVPLTPRPTHQPTQHLSADQCDDQPAEDRVHALKNDTLQSLLDSVVFEPSRYLPKKSSAAPAFVPAKDEAELNTPYGLLLNELARSPLQVVSSTVQLMKRGLTLDTAPRPPR